MLDIGFKTHKLRDAKIAQKKSPAYQKLFVLWSVMFVISLPGIGRSQPQAPHRLAGFVLGGNIADYADQIRRETILPIRYLESLKEAETVPLKGYKTALVIYGTCIKPARIVRLKYKYADSSKAFYDELLKRFKRLYGDPDEWRGDAFHVVLAWKWSFMDENNNDISLILQHNTRDEEEKEGNAVKLTMWNLMREEARCFESRVEEAPAEQDRNQTFAPQRPKSIDWNWFVPQP